MPKGKEKRRYVGKHTAPPDKVKRFMRDLLVGVLSGLIATIICRLLGL